MNTAGVRVRGPASAEELAAVVAVLSGRAMEPAVDALQRWRALRVAALRHDTRPFAR